MPAQATGRGDRSVSVLLGDRARRAVVLALGDARGQALSAAAITQHSLVGATPRLIRDRIRELTRAGILVAVDVEATSTTAPPRWLLTPAGQDLYRLQSLVTRIVSHAANLDATTSSRTREQTVEATLKGLADPVVIQLARSLAGEGTLDPVELEEACRPTPRRTLYRRLSPLVECGVITRTTTPQVPPSTNYSLSERWRPAVAILMLSAWWERRHHGPTGRADAIDLEDLLHGILPIVRVGRVPDGTRVMWVVGQAAGTAELVLEVQGGRLKLVDPSVDAVTGEPQATELGTAASWTSALVTDERDGLTVTGDEATARAILTAVRSALLNYVR